MRSHSPHDAAALVRSLRRLGIRKYVGIVAAVLVAAGTSLFVAIPHSLKQGVAHTNANPFPPYSLSKLLATVRPAHLTTSEQQELQAAIASVPNVQVMQENLTSKGVRVRVDGVTVTLGELALHTTGFDQDAIANAVNNAVVDGLNVQEAISEVQASTAGLKEAVAYLTLVQLLVNYSTANGTSATQTAAEATAQTSYKQYLHLQGTPTALNLPAGKTPRTAFFSPSAIASYQQSLTVDQAIASIAGQRSTVPSGNRTPILAQWVEGQLVSNAVTIQGVPGMTPADIPSSLPSGL
jgi:hypothetical protein